LGKGFPAGLVLVGLSPHIRYVIGAYDPGFDTILISVALLEPARQEHGGLHKSTQAKALAATALKELVNYVRLWTGLGD
jgi:hypothetical protein